MGCDWATVSRLARRLTRDVVVGTVVSVNDPPLTDYFRNDVLAKRPYIRLEWCLEALANPVRCEVQPEDGRVRHWVYVQELASICAL
mgnify:CR=1 FL=1